MNRPKYRYPEEIQIENRVWPTRRISAAPIWAAVDLRDGNQAFVEPMDVETKIRYFAMLTAIGFKEIEVAYPAASHDEFEFVRRLIGEGLIPDDVTIGVFTAAKQPLIDRTAAAIAGAKNAIMHCYVATSDLHGRFVFGKSREELARMAVDGTKMIADAVARLDGGRIRYEFSPEEFTDSDINFIADMAARVRETWTGPGKQDFILNLPSTVERRPPYQYADMIEAFTCAYPYMAETTLSVHAHNDQSCAVAAAEMAMLAGAERVEGTLCGHGERAGNMDSLVFALNLHARGIDTGLDFSHLPEIAAFIAEVSGIAIHPRQPYAGELVFTAFSGTHQDAIGKCMARREEISDCFDTGWKMPYLHIDPADIGRNYDRLIRINSQSGKGGVAFVLESVYGIKVPAALRPELARAVQEFAESSRSEVSAADIYRIFVERIARTPGRIRLVEAAIRSGTADTANPVAIELTIRVDGVDFELRGGGNGPVAAAAAALRNGPGLPDFELKDYAEQALTPGAEAEALAFVTLAAAGRECCGAGVDAHIDRAAIRAMLQALSKISE